MKLHFHILQYVSLVSLLVSCNGLSKNQITNNHNFPLKQETVIDVGNNIQSIAVSDDWVAVATPGKVSAINKAAGNALWSINNAVDLESLFKIINNELIFVSNNQVLMIDKLGTKKVLNLDRPDETVQLIAIYPNYIYAIRIPDWSLEVYDISSNTLVWEIPVGRGNTIINWDSAIDITYVTTAWSISAYNTETGALIWQKLVGVGQSILSDNVLYIAKPNDIGSAYAFQAIDTKTQKDIWSEGLIFYTNIYGLSSINNMLLASTRNGILAFDKYTGVKVWQSAQNDIFYTAPLLLNGFLYAKGSSQSIYAISPNSGEVIGYLETGSSILYEPYYESIEGVYLSGDELIFNTTRTIFIYK